MEGDCQPQISPKILNKNNITFFSQMTEIKKTSLTLPFSSQQWAIELFAIELFTGVPERKKETA